MISWTRSAGTGSLSLFSFSQPRKSSLIFCSTSSQPLVQLARRVGPVGQAFLGEHVAQQRHLGILDEALGEVRRDEDDALAFGDHDVAGQH